MSVNFTAKTFKSDFNITLLACNTGGTVAGHLSAKLYSCQIYDNGTLVRDFKPCISASGDVGFNSDHEAAGNVTGRIASFADDTDHEK